MTLFQPDFLRPFTIGFFLGTCAVAMKFAIEYSSLAA